jgi:hypothetical protein
MLGLTCHGALKFSVIGVEKTAKVASCVREKSWLFHLNSDS